MTDMITTNKMAILAIAFFNTDYVRRSLLHLINHYRLKDLPLPYDIYVLENDSPKSAEMKLVLEPYKPYIKKYIKSSGNSAASIIIDVFQQELISRDYEYYAVTEADVLVEEGAIDECLTIMNKHNFNICSVSLKLDNAPLNYSVSDIKSWIPVGPDRGDYFAIHTGFQFVVMRNPFFFAYLKHVVEVNKFIIDGKLRQFCEDTGNQWASTKTHKLLHIGWDLYTHLPNEYTKYKEEIAKAGKLWKRDANITLTEIW